MSRNLLSLAVWAALGPVGAGCRPQPAAPPRPAAAQAAEAGRPPSPPTVHARLPPISIPLLDGGHLQLVPPLRGRWIVYIAPPFSSGAGRSALARWAGRLAAARPPGGGGVVVVGTGQDHDALVRAWGVAPPGVVYGWDPQGAVPARLGVQALPAIWLVEPDGRVAVRASGETAAAFDCWEDAGRSWLQGRAESGALPSCVPSKGPVRPGAPVRGSGPHGA